MSLKLNMHSILLTLGFVFVLCYPLYAQKERKIQDGSFILSANPNNSQVFLSTSLSAEILGQSTLDQINKRDYYLKKSKSQKTAGWILVGGGTTLIIGGAVFFTGAAILSIATLQDPAKNGTVVAAYILLTGVVADIVSIPFFISAAHNKRIASSISLGTNKFHDDQINYAFYPVKPSITLKIRF